MACWLWCLLWRVRGWLLRRVLWLRVVLTVGRWLLRVRGVLLVRAPEPCAEDPCCEEEGGEGDAVLLVECWCVWAGSVHGLSEASARTTTAVMQARTYGADSECVWQSSGGSGRMSSSGEAACVEAEAKARGRWLVASGVWPGVAAERAGAAVSSCVARGVLVRRGLLVAHTYVVAVEAAARAGERVDVSGWAPDKLAFARCHAGGLGCWFDPGLKVLRRATRHNVHDRASLWGCIAGSGTGGVSLCELVAEYPLAHVDLWSLVCAEESGVFVLDGQIWRRQECLSMARRLETLPSKSSRGGTTRGAPAGSKRRCTR